MKLLIVRHGDPNYEIDSLTEKGWREAEYLSEKQEESGGEGILCITSGTGERYGLPHNEKSGERSSGM